MNEVCGKLKVATGDFSATRTMWSLGWYLHSELNRIYTNSLQLVHHSKLDYCNAPYYVPNSSRGVVTLEQTSAAQNISSRFRVLFVFIRFWPHLSHLFYSIFWPKRPSTIARSVVPLTTPLHSKLDYCNVLYKYNLPNSSKPIDIVSCLWATNRYNLVLDQIVGNIFVTYLFAYNVSCSMYTLNIFVLTNQH